MPEPTTSSTCDRPLGRPEVEFDALMGLEHALLARPRDVASATSSAIAEPKPARATASLDSPEIDLFAPRPARTAPAEVDAPARSPEPRATTRAERPPMLGSAAPADAAVPTQPLRVELVERVVPPAGATKSERLATLERLHAEGCPHCTTATAHRRLVFGEGNPDAELAFVGEAPGETEDQLGRPFVGRAGEKLEEMIAAMGLRREDVYIANVLKSRPPDNRTPLAHEVERCGPYLLAQLSIIRPKAIVTLGGPASKLLLASELGITRLRGVFGKVVLGASEGAPFEVPVMPTFHPAFLLRNYTPETRKQVWEDLKQVLAVLGREIPARRASPSRET